MALAEIGPCTIVSAVTFEKNGVTLISAENSEKVFRVTRESDKWVVASFPESKPNAPEIEVDDFEHRYDALGYALNSALPLP